MKPMTYGEIRKRGEEVFKEVHEIMYKLREQTDRTTESIERCIESAGRERVRRGLFTVEDIIGGK